MRTPFSLLASPAFSSVLFVGLAGFTGLVGCSSNGSTGSDSGSPATQAQATQFCMSACAKENSCNGTLFDCNVTCASDAGVTSDCDTNAYLASANACVSGTCAALASCLTQAMTSANCGPFEIDAGNLFGGDGAAPNCNDCAKATACCVALDAVEGQDGGNCTGLTVDECMSQSTVDQSLVAAGCDLTITLGKLAGVVACM